ncbi:hypothetical protein B0H16DRAFT_1476122, partial [Mycena metata]
MLGGSKEQIGAGDPNSAILDGSKDGMSCRRLDGISLRQDMPSFGPSRWACGAWALNFLLDRNFHQVRRIDPGDATPHTAHTTNRVPATPRSLSTAKPTSSSSRVYMCHR